MHRWLFGCFLVFVQNTLFSASQESMLHHLSTVENIFMDKYAPVVWKKEHLNWTLKDAAAQAKQQISTSTLLTVKHYQRILRAFFQSFSDYHVNIVFYSTEKASLPFAVRNAGSKYFVVEAQTDTLANMRQNGSYSGDELISAGCQILKFDHTPIEQVVEELIRTEFNNRANHTNYHLANVLLTTRLGQLGQCMPNQWTEVQFRSPAGKIIEAKIEWLYTAEELLYKPLCHSMWMTKPKLGDTLLMFSPWANLLLRKPQRINHLHAQSAEEDALLPDSTMQPRLMLGEIAWQEDEPSIFTAYIYTLPNSNKRIGYLRIHSYMPSEIMSEINTLVQKLADIINYFEQHTEALVVDQVDNGGGIVHYAYAIASLLTNRPLDLPLHQLALTHKDVMENLLVRHTIKEQLAHAEDLIEAEKDATPALFFGYPFDRAFFEQALHFANFIVDEWNQGKTLTSKFPIGGIFQLQPHPLGSYSKPILMLINAKDFSGADFVPAILQDNKRAWLFGEQTAGAGGCVEMCSFPNLFGIEYFSYTSSFAERLDGTPLENLGVKPDIPYSIQEIDLLDNFSGYIKAVNATVCELLDSR